jgi:hypothetical protein
VQYQKALIITGGGSYGGGGSGGYKSGLTPIGMQTITVEGVLKGFRYFDLKQKNSN